MNSEPIPVLYERGDRSNVEQLLFQIMGWHTAIEEALPYPDVFIYGVSIQPRLEQRQAVRNFITLTPHYLLPPPNQVSQHLDPRTQQLRHQQAQQQPSYSLHLLS